MTRMVTPGHRARQGPRKRRRCEEMQGRRHSHSEMEGEARERACRSDVVRVEVFASAKMSSLVSERPRLRSEIGEVRGSLRRITELLAREAAVRGSAGAASASLSSSQAAPHGTDGLFLAREAAVQGGAGAALSSSSSSSSQAAPRGTDGLFFTREAAVKLGVGTAPSSSSQAAPRGTNGLLLATAEPQPEAAATASSKRRKTIPSIEPRTNTNPAKASHDASERHNAEPDVLVRAAYLKIRFAGLIAKSQETISLRHREDLKRQPAADVEAVDEGSRGRDAEREMARKALQEVERNARHTRLSVETIHPMDLNVLGITAIEHIVSPERHRDRDGVLRAKTAVHRPRSPLEKLGLFVKADDGGEQEVEEGESR